MTSATLLIALLAALALVSPAAAKGPKPAQTGTLTLVMVEDMNGDGAPNHGDTITFSVSTAATTTPRVRLSCYQATTLVLYTQAGFYPTYLWPDARLMTLASGAWLAGAADCHAELYYLDVRGRTKVLTALDFAVGA